MTMLPRDDLVRALSPGFELRSPEDGGMPTLFGHFAVFDRWTEIDSLWEGNFLERIARGAFRKTFRENRSAIKPLFQHGHDPQIGDKPLGAAKVLREDETGAYYEVPLLDTSYNRDLVPGLEAGLYGASFRFRVVKEEINDSPDPSDANPRGLPERTIKELRLYEFGPVTFPAYEDATAAVRSLTDDYLWDRLSRDPDRLANFLEQREAPILSILVSRDVARTTDDEPTPALSEADDADEPDAESTPDVDEVESRDEEEDVSSDPESPAEEVASEGRDEVEADAETDATEDDPETESETDDEPRSFEFWFAGADRDRVSLDRSRRRLLRLTASEAKENE